MISLKKLILRKKDNIDEKITNIKRDKRDKGEKMIT